MLKILAHVLGWRESSKKGQPGYVQAVFNSKTTQWFSGQLAWKKALLYSLRRK